ncbi:MAG: polyketide synthase [Chloroflexota bacterium]
MPKCVTSQFLEEGILELNVDDAEAQNRLTVPVIEELSDALDTLADDPALKVVILTGREDVFCAGGTLEMLHQIMKNEFHDRHLILPRKLLDFPLPVVCAAHGHAIGGGLMLALYCDLVVASESSRYSANFAHMGFTPGMGGTTLLPYLVGPHFAGEMMLTAKFYKGRELHGRGLFNYIVPGEDVMEVALDLAQQMAEKPRHVLELLKESLALPRRQALAEAVSREDLMHKLSFNQPETAERIESSYLR